MAAVDYRLSENRRETFHKFYQFALKTRGHPGAVYYVMPYLAERFKWNMEQKLWFAYLNGNTQNPVMSWLVFKNYPEPISFLREDGEAWFNTNWPRLQWDTDRRYQKKNFPTNVAWYCDFGAYHQEQAFYNIFCGHEKLPDEQTCFRRLWAAVRGGFPSFGRLAAFSYLEYLRIMGLPIDCDNLFLEDMDGSASHRNGLALLTNRGDLIRDKQLGISNLVLASFDIEMLREEGRKLLQEAKQRNKGTAWENDVSYFTLESALCTYKSWHKPNRRYPNVYNDMLHDRIKWAEQRWPEEDFGMFWQARQAYLPLHLRLEDNTHDPGLKPEKQNWYLNTGMPVMMSRDYPEFDNEFDRRCWS